MKHYPREDGFLAEMRIFELIQNVAPDNAFLPHAVKAHEPSRAILISPLARWSWADAELTAALTWKVLQAACAVLPILHGNGFVHGDISPSNILVCADGSVVINDFSCSLPIANELDHFIGTLDFASDAVGDLSRDRDESSPPYTYLPLDDHKSLFFAVLSRFWPSSSSASSCKPHLPWSNQQARAKLLQSKANHIANSDGLIFTTKLRDHVSPPIFEFLRRWFQLLFRAEAVQGGAAPDFCDGIVHHLKTFADAVGPDAIADDGARPQLFIARALLLSSSSLIISDSRRHFLLSFCPCHTPLSTSTRSLHVFCLDLYARSFRILCSPTLVRLRISSFFIVCSNRRHCCLDGASWKVLPLQSGL